MKPTNIIYKALCMLIAVAGMTLGLSSCSDEKEEPDTKPWVKYHVQESPETQADPDVLKEVMAAFNEAIGNTGGIVKTYAASLDEQKIKDACEATRKRYADIKNSYIKVVLSKSSGGGIGESYNIELLGIYEMGQLPVE